MNNNVSREKLNEMADSNCCALIAEGKDVKILHYLGEEIVITCSCSKADGVVSAGGYKVVDFKDYTGSIKPLRYSEHGDEIMKGKRERGYSGQIVMYKKRKLVMTERLEFTSTSKTISQMSLF